MTKTQSVFVFGRKSVKRTELAVVPVASVQQQREEDREQGETDDYSDTETAENESTAQVEPLLSVCYANSF